MGLDNPINQNLLQGTKFQLAFLRLPYVNFFVQQVNIPGISTSTVTQTTPLKDIPYPSDKMNYENLSMTFLVDEAMWSWTSVVDWLKGMTFPDSFEEYKTMSMQQRLIAGSNEPEVSDAILTIFTNKNNPILTVNFKDIFPVELSGIQFNVEDDANVIKTATAMFAVPNYSISREV